MRNPNALYSGHIPTAAVIRTTAPIIPEDQTTIGPSDFAKGQNKANPINTAANVSRATLSSFPTDQPPTSDASLAPDDASDTGGASFICAFPLGSAEFSKHRNAYLANFVLVAFDTVYL